MLVMDVLLFFIVVLMIGFFLFTLMNFLEFEEEEDDYQRDSTEERLEVLLEGLMDTRKDVAQKARNRILAMGPPILPRLASLLSQEVFLAQEPLRIRRLRSLMVDFGLRAIPPLLQLLQEEGDDPLVASAVCGVLEEVGDIAAPLLAERYRHPLAQHLLPVLLSWEERGFRESLAVFRLDPSRKEWDALFRAWLQTDKAPFYTELLEKAYHEAPKSEKGRKILSILSATPTPQTQAIWHDLARSEEPALRRFALEGLSGLVDERVIRFCVDPDLSLREAACEALRAEAFAPHKERLVDALQEAQRQALASQDLRSLLATEKTLLVWQGQANLSVVELLYNAEDLRLRCESLRLLSGLPSQEALRFLRRALEAPEKPLYQAALKSLVSLRGVEAAELIVATMEERGFVLPPKGFVEDALHALARMGVAGLPGVRQLLHHDSEKAFALAFSALLWVDEKEAIPEILAIVQEDAVFRRIQEKNLLQLHRFLSKMVSALGAADALQHFLSRFPETPLRPMIEDCLQQEPEETLPQNPRRSVATDA
jgi:HEAT repeat protein